VSPINKGRAESTEAKGKARLSRRGNEKTRTYSSGMPKGPIASFGRGGDAPAKNSGADFIQSTVEELYGHHKTQPVELLSGGRDTAREREKFPRRRLAKGLLTMDAQQNAISTCARRT